MDTTDAAPTELHPVFFAFDATNISLLSEREHKNDFSDILVSFSNTIAATLLSFYTSADSAKRPLKQHPRPLEICSIV